MHGEKEGSTSAAKFAPTWAQIEKVHDSDKLHPRCCDILNNRGRKVGSLGKGVSVISFKLGGFEGSKCLNPKQEVKKKKKKSLKNLPVLLLS